MKQLKRPPIGLKSSKSPCTRIAQLFVLVVFFVTNNAVMLQNQQACVVVLENKGLTQSLDN